MNARYSNIPDATNGIVYVRAIAVVDLPEDLQNQIEGVGVVYSVHRADGARVAVVRDRALAFALARDNDIAAVSVH
jgi:hypothetical protein